MTKKIGINGIDRPEECETMMRDPVVDDALDYLRKYLERGGVNTELELNLRVLLDDHTTLEEEVQRLGRLLRTRPILFPRRQASAPQRVRAHE